MAGKKARQAHETQFAALRVTEVAPCLEGKLVRVPGNTSEDQKVYCVISGRKHWVTTPDWLTTRKMRLEDTIEVSRDLFANIVTGPPLT